MGIDKFNSEGYYDPTTYTALTNIHRDEMAAERKAAYRPLVYICSPYAGDIANNVKNARKYSRFAFEQNTIPLAAHLLFPQFMDDENPRERDAAMHFNYVLLGKCEELWVFGDTVSQGMAHEISIAKKRRQKIETNEMRYKLAVKLLDLMLKNQFIEPEEYEKIDALNRKTFSPELSQVYA